MDGHNGFGGDGDDVSEGDGCGGGGDCDDVGGNVVVVVVVVVADGDGGCGGCCCCCLCCHNVELHIEDRHEMMGAAFVVAEDTSAAVVLVEFA